MVPGGGCRIPAPLAPGSAPVAQPPPIGIRRVHNLAVVLQNVPMSATLSKLPLAQRNPRRLSITVPFHVFASLEERATAEGRSLSNLCAYLIEAHLHQQPAPAARRQALIPVVSPHW